MGFEEGHPTGKSGYVLLRTRAWHSPSPGYLSTDRKINKKQQVKAQ